MRPHIVCIPFPTQGHINPMLKLAKLLHHKGGFYITFVHTEYNHRRLLKSCGQAALPDFRFVTIPDGLPPDAIQDIVSLCVSITTTCLEPFCDLLTELNRTGGDVPPVSYIVSDGMMSFTLKAAERFGLPEALFWTTSACGMLGYTECRRLVERGYTPLKDMKQVASGYMDTIVDDVPGMKDIKLRDFPSFIRTTNPDDVMLNFFIEEAEAVSRANALILNTVDQLEQDVLDGLALKFPNMVIYTLGPLHLMLEKHVADPRLGSMSSSLWTEDTQCIDWLDSKPPSSVAYVNFGSITMVTADQLTEFAWGLANSRKTFLWIIRPDIVAGDSAMLPPEFVTETEGRCMMSSWCPQEKVLGHRAVGGFLTHSGWNSTLESIAGGVPVICWPFLAEQQTNCRYSCVEWEIGMEIDNDVKRHEVEVLVRELMDGDKGRRMKEKAVEWKRKTEAAAEIGGSSYLNLDKLIKEVLLLE